LTRYQLSDSQIDLIWKYIGGSMWEISSLLGELIGCSKNNKISNNKLNDKIQKMIDENCGRFTHYARLNKSKILLLKEIYIISKQKDCFKAIDLKSLIYNKVYEDSTLSEELNRLVQSNYLAFHPTISNYQLQGKIMFYGLQQFVKSIPEDFLARI
ncbi:ATPase, partial [Candidatus Magnetomorum sp. HK-1]